MGNSIQNPKAIQRTIARNSDFDHRIARLTLEQIGVIARHLALGLLSALGQ